MMMFKFRTALPILNHVLKLLFETVHNCYTIKQALMFPVKDLMVLQKLILHYITSYATKFNNTKVKPFDLLNALQ